MSSIRFALAMLTIVGPIGGFCIGSFLAFRIAGELPGFKAGALIGCLATFSGSLMAATLIAGKCEEFLGDIGVLLGLFIGAFLGGFILNLIAGYIGVLVCYLFKSIN
jgi:hypothetical protein